MALKLIGAGLGRTGTLSLKAALERIGYGPCYHMIEVLTAPERARHWLERTQSGSHDWDAIFHGYRDSRETSISPHVWRARYGCVPS
jgi:hypothetical protein